MSMYFCMTCNCTMCNLQKAHCVSIVRDLTHCPLLIFFLVEVKMNCTMSISPLNLTPYNSTWKWLVMKKVKGGLMLILSIILIKNSNSEEF